MLRTWNPKYRAYNLKNSHANSLPSKNSLKTQNLEKVYDFWETIRY